MSFSTFFLKKFRRGAGDGLPRLKNIEQFHKKKRQSKAERLADIREGRDEEKTYGKPKKNVSLLLSFYNYFSS